MVPFQQYCRKGATLYPYIQWGDHRLSVDRYVGSNSSGLGKKSGWQGWERCARFALLYFLKF